MNSAHCGYVILIFVFLPWKTIELGLVGYEENCAHDDECEHQGIVECVDSICACPNTSQELLDTTCQTRAQRTLYGFCDKPYHKCNEDKNLICKRIASGFRCACPDEFTWNFTQWVCKPNPNGTCPHGQQYVQGSMTCKSKGGESCLEDGVLRDDLCASGVCHGEDTTQDGLQNRCACADDGGFKQYWEPFHGCLIDYYGLSCSPSYAIEDCEPEPRGRINGLACQEKNRGWFCACDKANHVYFLGRCVEADRTHGQACDPYGVGQSTCKIDPAIALVCRKDGAGNGKCECRKMGMNSTDGKTIFVDLSWNATAQKCELEMKKEGMMCKADGECKTRKCSGSRCVVARAGMQIQGGKILIVVTVIFTILQ